jgi:hypothetical protein
LADFEDLLQHRAACRSPDGAAGAADGIDRHAAHEGLARALGQVRAARMVGATGGELVGAGGSFAEDHAIQLNAEAGADAGGGGGDFL